ncbi:MAG: PDZ domain-containing protein [Saprospiraceae bacterium]|nr:PDZ domain-containing protein [Saprospiraceae bacterium]
MKAKVDKYKMPTIILIVLVALWAILGLMDMKNNTTDGYRTDGNSTIIQIDQDSPAEAAGLQVGDRLISIDGTGVNDTKSWELKSRAKVGDTWSYVVDRNGEEMAMDLTFASPSGSSKMLNYAGFLLGLIFLLCGIWIFMTNKSYAAALFSVFSILFSLTFFGGPYLSSPAMRDISNIVTTTLFLGAFAYLVKFLLQFPSQRSPLGTSKANYLIFGPVVLLAVIIIILELLDPEWVTGLRTGMRVLFGLTIVYYFGWALLTLIKRYNSSTAEERSAKGINLMLIGAILGLVPILILIIINTVSPSTIIPGGDYAFLTLGLIPISFALALNKE